MSQGQTNNVNVFVVVSPTTYQLDLKAIEGETPTSNFKIKPESVVQVKQGDNLVVVTQPSNLVDKVKVTDSNNVTKTLLPLGNNAYSLTGFPVGAYNLDVIVNLPNSNDRGAYETILVILEKGQQPIQPTQIINKVKIRDDIRIIFEDGTGNNGNQTGLPPEECQPGFVLVGDNCERIVCPAGSELDSNGRICEPMPNPPCDPSSPECAATECPDGRIMPPGKPCPDDALPCDDPNAPEGCSVPTECPDGTIIPPGEQCPEEDSQGEQGEGDEDNGSGSNDNDDEVVDLPSDPESEDEDNEGTDTDTDTG